MYATQISMSKATMHSLRQHSVSSSHAAVVAYAMHYLSHTPDALGLMPPFSVPQVSFSSLGQSAILPAKTQVAPDLSSYRVY